MAGGHRAVPPPMSFDEAARRARAMAVPGTRRLLGITGMPGAGKSTLARHLVESLGPSAICAPMDGFHLANAELIRLGRSSRKGAPDTFDAAGYVALLQRVRTAAPGVTVYAPEFRREIEEPIAGAIPIEPSIPLVITEGNYLLVRDEVWEPARRLLDECWYVEAPESLRVERLIARHISYGKTPDEAARWVLGPDQANAELVAGTRRWADVIVRLG